MCVKDWKIWMLAGLVVLNLFISVWSATRPAVPVSSLTLALYQAGGDARVLMLRIQQLEAALQQASQEIEQLRKAKGGGK